MTNAARSEGSGPGHFYNKAHLHERLGQLGLARDPNSVAHEAPVLACRPKRRPVEAIRPSEGQTWRRSTYRVGPPCTSLETTRLGLGWVDVPGDATVSSLAMFGKAPLTSLTGRDCCETRSHSRDQVFRCTRTWPACIRLRYDHV